MHVSKRSALAVAGVAAIAFAVPALADQGHQAGGTGSQPCTNMSGTADGTFTYSPTSMWPPNHKMHTVTITYNAPADAPGDTTSWMVTGIIDDQANADGTGELNGSGAPTDVQGLDWTGVGNGASGAEGTDQTATVQLRAERSGLSQAGRTYSIMVSCGEQDAGTLSDPSATGTAILTVTVPHDQGNN